MSHIIKEIGGYVVCTTVEAPFLIIRGDHAEAGQTPDLAIGYALCILNERYPDRDSHEVRIRDYPDNRVLSVRVFKSLLVGGPGSPDWLGEPSVPICATAN